jgi:hypothetical protein
MSDEQKTALEVIREELKHRREKQWKIFSWSATVLLAAIGGVITLVVKEQFVFPTWQRVTMAGALIVIAFYSCVWICENIDYEKRLRGALIRLLDQTGVSKHLIPSPDQLIPDPKDTKPAADAVGFWSIFGTNFVGAFHFSEARESEDIFSAIL